MINDGIPFKFLNDITKMKEQQMTRGWKFRTRVESTVSDELRDLLNKMLEPNVSVRLNIEEIMAHTWSANPRPSVK